MPLSLSVSCFSKIQIGFTFLVPAHAGSPWKRAVKCVCVYHVFSTCHLMNSITACVLFVTDCVSGPGTAIGCVCPSACFHSSFWTNIWPWPFACTSHERSQQSLVGKIFKQVGMKPGVKKYMSDIWWKMMKVMESQRHGFRLARTVKCRAVVGGICRYMLYTYLPWFL